MLRRTLDTNFWENVRTNTAYAPIIDEIKKEYDDNYSETIEELKFANRWKFYENGDRFSFEEKYFMRRKHLSSAVILALIYPEEQHYIDEVNELLWALCGEYSWVLPAHTDGTIEQDLSWIDLFNAETGFALAEICHVLGDKVKSLVKARVDYELKRRIIEPFKPQTFSWETSPSNWASVCACCVAGVLYYSEPELFREYIPRFNAAMSYFTKSYSEDGTCVEGPSYWLYGMGYFTWYADMLYTFTDGKQDLLDNEKIKKMAGYMQRSYMAGDCLVSFSDGLRSGKASIAIQYYLNSRLPDSVDLLPDRLMAAQAPNIRWAHYIRAFEYYDPEKSVSEIPLKDYYLESAGQVILNREKYSFAIKSGHNDESHNHNDVASFIFADKSGQVFCDIGCGRYTQQYFDYALRYKRLCCSSRGHNLPIIGGEEQVMGIESKGELSYKNGIITVDYASAYRIPSLTKLVRTITPTDDGIILCDEFDTDEAFVERLVTFIKPIISQGNVRVGNVEVTYSSNDYDVTVIEEMHEPHAGNESEQTVYCIDFALKNGAKKAELNITVKN